MLLYKKLLLMTSGTTLVFDTSRKCFYLGGKLFLVRYEAASLSSSFRNTTFRGNDVFHLEGSQY